MLNKEVFIQQIEKLVIEYEDKGFKMSKERAEQWYELLKELPEYSLCKAIENVLKTFKFPPSMSEIYTIASEIHAPIGPIKVIRMGVVVNERSTGT